MLLYECFVLHVCLFAKYAWSLRRPEKELQAAERYYVGAGNLNPGHLQEPPMLLTSEISLQPPRFIVLIPGL